MILKKILPLTMVATGFLTAEATEKPIIKISTDDTEMVIDVMMQLYSSGEAEEIEQNEDITLADQNEGYR